MNNGQPTAIIKAWLTDPLPPDVKRIIDLLARTEDIHRIAIMPDVHLSKDACIGTVIGTSHRIFPQAIGGDIGCGIAAIRFNCQATIIDNEKAAARLLSGLSRLVPAMVQPPENRNLELLGDLSHRALSHLHLEKVKTREAQRQLGTLGRGNHFLEFQQDEEKRLWLMVHSGSRAIGQMVNTFHAKMGRSTPKGLIFFDANSDQGKAYFQDVEWASLFAQTNRQVLISRVTTLMNQLFSVTVDPGSFLSCQHNFVRKETHEGVALWVHRKGAISATAGEPGIIPGSMGTCSYHVEGKGYADALCSSSHGAGRLMPRSQARQQIPVHKFFKEMSGIWFDHRRASSLREEAPSAYKDVKKVMRAQKPLTKIVRRLTPILSYKGS